MRPTLATAERMAAEYRTKLPRTEAGDAYCPECRTVIPKHDFFCRPCSDRRYAQERLDNARRSIVERLDRWLNEVWLPEWDYARIGNPAWERRIAKPVLDAAKAWDMKRGLAFAGFATGSGKTSTLVARIHAIRGEAVDAASRMVTSERADNLVPRKTRFLTFADLVAARRAPFRSTDEGNEQPIKDAKGCPVLVLDEIGYEGNDWISVPLLGEIIDARDKLGSVVTCITTGLGPTAFADRYGAQVWRRIRDRAQVVQPGAK